MANGTIYWDEASRGLRENGKPYSRGRWVGEITINGRRMRKRSKDYNVVLDFVNGKEKERAKNKTVGPKLSSLIGFSRYGIDLSTGKIWNKRLKIEIKVDGKQCVRMVDDNKKYKTLTYRRMLFACQKGVDYFKIPKDVIIVEGRDGELELKDKTELLHECASQYFEYKSKHMINILNIKIREAELLKEYYKTKDYSKLYEYMYSLKDKCVRHCIIKRGWSKDRAIELFELSVESILNSLVERPSTLTNLQTRIRYEMMERMKMCRHEHNESALLKIGRKY